MHPDISKAAGSSAESSTERIRGTFRPGVPG
jgi:hypothetical protein